MATMPVNLHGELKERHRREREGWPETLALRTHRALSWYGRAMQETDDPDARFLFLWIAFNAAYARDYSERPTLGERKLLLDFLRRLIRLDTDGRLYALVWNDFAGPFRTLLDNRFVYQPFWDALRRGEPDAWREGFERSRRRALRALGERDTERVLAVIFDRLYVLRNQLVHGGATWASSVNRAQVRDGAAIMARLVPEIVRLMMDHPHEPWGQPCWPVVPG